MDDDGGLDEVVATGAIHIERMDQGAWWIGITRHDGVLIHVNLCAKNPSRTVVRGMIEENP